MYVYIDGEFFPKEKAQISVFDHGLLYGDGVFEGIRAYNGGIFKLDEHIDRLYQSAHTIGIKVPIAMDELRQLHLEIMKKNNLQEGYIRTIITRGKGDLGLDPKKCKVPTVIVIADKISLYPQEFYDNGLNVVTVSMRRPPVDSLNGRVKSLNYLNNIMARMEAGAHGAQEALMLNHQGLVVECSADNIFIVNGRTLTTPPSWLGALEGITRNAVIDMALSLDYIIKEVPFTLHDIYNADEAFLTGTAAEIASIVTLDGRTIGSGKPGPVSRRIKEFFPQFVADFITPIPK
jgi:branched-chain amino acid aminotransferase